MHYFKYQTIELGGSSDSNVARGPAAADNRVLSGGFESTFTCRIGKHWPTEMHARDPAYPNFRDALKPDANTLCGAQVSGPYAEQVCLLLRMIACSLLPFVTGRCVSAPFTK